MVTISAPTSSVTTVPAFLRKAATPRDVAADVYWLPVRGTNVYFVRSGAAWVLIDAAWANCGQMIRQAASALFGEDSPPSAIVLTHVHPDHDGAVLELVRAWGCPVYVPEDEFPLAVAGDLATIERYANPLDRGLILPVLRVLGSRRVASMLSKTSLEGVARPFSAHDPVPGLPDWKCIPTPGHSPGHVAFFRESDRFLLTGDALLTINLDSLWGWVSWGLHLNKPCVSAPPGFTNWSEEATKESIAVLADLEPRVLASGHGAPMLGDSVAGEMHAFASHVAGFTGAKPADVPLSGRRGERRMLAWRQ
jgi:glyoxylase-like metal-dependent hydrolase (beta-lactamase superfamily II)